MRPRVTLNGALRQHLQHLLGRHASSVDVGESITSAPTAPADSRAKSIPVGNTSNPAGFNGSIVQPFVKYPYSPLFGPFNQNGSSTVTPFQMYFTANIRV